MADQPSGYVVALLTVRMSLNEPLSTREFQVKIDVFCSVTHTVAEFVTCQFSDTIQAFLDGSDTFSLSSGGEFDKRVMLESKPFKIYKVGLLYKH